MSNKLWLIWRGSAQGRSFLGLGWWVTLLPIKREYWPRGSICALEEEKKGKDRTGQEKKPQKGYTSPIWGEAPTQTICIKNCVVAYLLDVITCPKFQNEIFRGYHFTWGRIFHFPIDIWMGLTKVQRYCATCDVVYIFSLFLLIRRNVRNRKVTKSVSC